MEPSFLGLIATKTGKLKASKHVQFVASIACSASSASRNRNFLCVAGGSNGCTMPERTKNWQGDADKDLFGSILYKYIYIYERGICMYDITH